ncbi:hypothetical protein HRR83_008310 [Exophiala dermatitidis]|uniref:Uncharacterized protein n=2 Tax=Exophiala dermatitidis TaxID=5970 RepID=H6C559_EXODN|nr:uncharacterized protein HMPREF1120_07754 [Exophiala dermatitidis NIH/UT8656]KAJ4505476.1 hypothetical protein HRR75_007345 [Exophiala dermatitidis]EHY59771.1 hypothetical protein HMPREF1120_07754 [Exophiala dermatitidis NIH/UT8656]KAJ4507079.1 hypothetical protein HRR73_007900 [Exophiala dermatitidis]KAJ4507675.1 hypothetical protein HRR74_008002 [Exophiala dermatitidis]KAJ4533022.1 hypothetical protein HRR76_007993 [Exophiala dermatitidis]
MLKSLFRRSRTARVPLQSGHIDVQRVSVTRQSKPVISRILTSFVLSYCVISTINQLLPKEQPKKSDQNTVASRLPEQPPQNASLPGSDFQPNEISLPLLWSIRKRRGLPYRPEDPEWKTFQKLQQDHKLVHDIKVQVAKLVEKEATRREQLIGFFRVIQPQEMRVSLELVVPLNRPPVYEVKYLVLKPGQTSVAWRQLPESYGSRLDRALHPIILGKAFYYGLKEFWVISYRITKARAVDRLTSAGLLSSSNTSTLNNIRPFYLSHLPTARRNLSEEEKAAQQLPIRRIPENDMKKMLPFLRGEYGQHESMQGYRDAVRTMTYQDAIESACTMFRLHWSLGQSKAAHTDARDPCHIIGHIEFVGERGKLRLDVFAVYSPKAKSLVGRPVITKAYGIPDATKWHDPRLRRRSQGFIQDVSQPKGNPGLKQTPPTAVAAPPSPAPPPPPPESVPDESGTDTDEKERREADEERDGEK